jgi:hypothetical protein
MKRRDFLKVIGATGASVFVPSSLSLMSMYRSANAAVNYTGVNVVAPSIMPQVINIYLYGGPSELAGNLTNIVDIENNSQSSYVDAFDEPGILTYDTDGTGINGQITPSGFWRDAGGVDMQFMLDQSYMSVYRTLRKIKDQTRSHRESILMNLKGSLDVNNGAGVGTRLAAMLYENRAQFEVVTTTLADGSPVIMTDLALPFVSFEGETPAFASDPDFSLPLELRNLTLSEDFDNPYSRNNNVHDTALDALVSKVAAPAYNARYQGVVDAFTSRATLEQRVTLLKTGIPVSPTTDTGGHTLPTLIDLDDIAANGGTSQLTYPNTNFTDRIRAAVTLAIENPSSLYITVGDGFGSWDDHNDVPARYPQRMAALMATLRAAMLHIKYSNGTTPGGLPRSTDNIVINVFGDFGRLVNLNSSTGWDHGNNQNLYTFGGAAVRPVGALGKVVGKTERVGDSGTNDQMTRALAGSYEFEPMSVAATIYSYFGATNPEILTADPVLNPNGDPVIDETRVGEPKLF